jgi:hypothetical protein
MADAKISALPTSTTPLAGTEVLPIVQGGQTRQVSIANVTAGRAVAALSVSTGTLGATGVATFSAGTVSAPAITTTGDTNTGIFFPAADTIAFAEGGSEAMRITDAGNVGIGTSSPTYKVDLGQQLLSFTATDTKVISRFANVLTVKRKFGDTAADTILFDIQCGAASANTQGGFEITVFAAGGKSGVSADRHYTAKWYVVRNDAGTFTITQLYQAGSVGAINVVANGNSLNINAIFSVINQGGCFAEIKGMLGPPNSGSSETAFTVVLP